MRFFLLALCALVLSASPAAAHGLGFFADMEQAVGYARKGDGLVLLFFTGTDWSQLSHELDVKVFEDSDFAEYANSTSFALLNADYPQRTKLDAAKRAELRALVAKHRITHFPSIVALTPDQAEIGRHEYRGEAAPTVTTLLEDWTAKNAELTQAAAAVAAPLTELKVGDSLPDLTFTGSDGQPLKLASMGGQAFVFTFIFTRCPLPDYCPLLGQKFREVQSKLRAKADAPKNWQLLSLTIDPKNDTPDVLAKYAKQQQADPQHWQFATSELTTISRLALALGADFWADKDGFITHHLRTVLVSPDGSIQAIYTDNQWSTDEMAVKIEGLAKQAKP